MYDCCGKYGIIDDASHLEFLVYSLLFFQQVTYITHYIGSLVE